MEIKARINPISYEKPLLKRTVEENIVSQPKKIRKFLRNKGGESITSPLPFVPAAGFCFIFNNLWLRKFTTFVDNKSV